MNNLIISNILGLLASIVMVYSCSINNKNKFIIVQIIMYILFILSQSFALAFTGSILNTISLIRNILLNKNKLNNRNKYILMLIMIISSIIIYLINKDLIGGLVSLLACLIFTYNIDLKDMFKFKIVIITCSTLWLIFDLYFKIYTSSIFDISSIITGLISIIILKKEDLYEKK